MSSIAHSIDPPSAPVSAPGAVSSGRGVLRRLASGALMIGIAVAAVGYGYYYWSVGRFLQSTDNAYIEADSTLVAPKVSGYIAEVLVEDNQQVEAGQILARIDDRDYRTALDEAEANVAGARADIGNIDAQLVEQKSVIAQAEAAIAADEASVEFARNDHERYRKMTAGRITSVQDEQRAETLLRQQIAQLKSDQAALAAARQRIAVLETARIKAEHQVRKLDAIARQARLDLDYAVIIAPISGTIGSRKIRIGQYVEAGTQLMAVVPLDAVYVVANFKETQLTHVRGGEPVEIRVDTFPDLALKGRVDSLSPASGLEFALLPPDNATGNFTKIVQRIPVKIVFEGALPTGLLRPGMSVEPTINTRGAGGAGKALAAESD
jgi:membrane fusion protein (multidrug efflux system)